jgi:LDH2 family malate/lactate/ureidoglycolate dehydrogenase
MGKIHNLRRLGKTVPREMILDGNGEPSTDPEVLFGASRGAILPFGHRQGHKGFGLGLLCEIMSGLLNATVPQNDEPEGQYANDMSIIAIDPSLFGPKDDFTSRIREYIAYITGCPPAVGFDEVLMPGTLENRTLIERRRNGIPMENEAVDSIRQACLGIGVEFTSKK